MGLIKKPKLRQYWSTDILYSTAVFRMAMKRTRFEAIQKILHFGDNAQCPPRDDPNFDRLYKIRTVIEHFSRKFAEAYTPQRDIAIDESLVHFKGRLKFRQYLPSKRSRYGIKLYKLCESTSGYTHRFRVYEGKDTQINPPECPPILGVSGKIVWELQHPLLDKGYHLYIDNFYTSIPLFKALSARGTAACGTVRKNQRGLPKPLIGQMLRKGESRAKCSDNMLVVKYKDKRDVLILTTIHRDNSTLVTVRGTTTQVPEPDCILDYNRYMGGVDLSDQVLQPYSAMRKAYVLRSYQPWDWKLPRAIQGQNSSEVNNSHRPFGGWQLKSAAAHTSTASDVIVSRRREHASAAWREQERGQPICQAAYENDLDEIQHLVEEDPDVVNVKDNFGGDTPLICACRRRNIKVVNYLLYAKADINLTNNDASVRRADASVKIALICHQQTPTALLCSV
ncbi:unnamed protein product [Ranitomeya imitator]|uniref:PiggyBac transposable element-derived protein domain-containing protein n=1 Tax=Ranitomeya imitator TaxID=111125 RepID=A0ABN9LER9_9NEOB|nr:unnamed protein product [Ranitomeya imitator]